MTMNQIEILFKREMKEQIFLGNKICTWRNKIYGEPGDTFPVYYDGEERIYTLLGVVPMQLSFVAKYLYTPEGFVSEDSMLRFMRALIRWHSLDVQRWGSEHFFERTA